MKTAERTTERALDLYGTALVEAMAFRDGPEAKSFLRTIAEVDCFDVRIRTARWFHARVRRADRRQERAGRSAYRALACLLLAAALPPLGGLGCSSPPGVTARAGCSVKETASYQAAPGGLSGSRADGAEIAWNLSVELSWPGTGGPGRGGKEETKP